MKEMIQFYHIVDKTEYILSYKYIIFLVYIINLIIFVPKKVGRNASNINFPLFKAIDGLFYKPNCSTL